MTGWGVWSAAGTTPEDLWHAALSGLSPARWHSLGSTRAIACVAPEPEPCPGFPQARRMDRSTRLALAAARPAAEMAGLATLDPTRIAVIVGNSRGPAELWASPPALRVRPTQTAHSAVGSVAGALSLALHARGPCFVVSATCASAAHAVALGASLLATGMADAVLAGGAEAPLVPALLDQFRAASLLGQHEQPHLACRPFDATRNGIIPGEGAGFLVLEPAANARHRRQPILAHLAGFGLAAESHNRVAARPDGEGLVRAIRIALDTARTPPDAIGHVNAHGTGTRINDLAESNALRTVFGDSLARIPITSTKPITGHTFGAAAALEAILAIQALRHGIAPPTATLTEPDPQLGLASLAARPQPFATDTVLSTSLGFWGNTAALVFRKAVGQIPPAA